MSIRAREPPVTIKAIECEIVDKGVVERSVSLLEAEGIAFVTGVAVGCRSVVQFRDPATTPLERAPDNGRFVPREIAGTNKTWPATLVPLALGFLGPEKGGMLEQLGRSSMPAVTSRPALTSRRACPASSPPATCAAAEGVDRYLRATAAR